MRSASNWMTEAERVKVGPGTSGAGPQRKRRITPQAGRGLEILGHAIEYLVDDHLDRNGTFTMDDGELTAVEMLMAANREIYFSCPVVPTLGERWAVFLERLRIRRLHPVAHNVARKKLNDMLTR